MSCVANRPCDVNDVNKLCDVLDVNRACVVSCSVTKFLAVQVSVVAESDGPLRPLCPGSFQRGQFQVEPISLQPFEIRYVCELFRRVLIMCS